MAGTRLLGPHTITLRGERIEADGFVDERSRYRWRTPSGAAPFQSTNHDPTPCDGAKQPQAQPPRKKRSPMARKTSGCSTHTVTIHTAAPKERVCPESARPIIEGFLKRLREVSWNGQGDMNSAIIEAQAELYGDCCDTDERDMGADLADALVAYIIATGVEPSEWRDLYPMKALALYLENPGQVVAAQQATAEQRALPISQRRTGGGGNLPALPQILDPTVNTPGGALQLGQVQVGDPRSLEARGNRALASGATAAGATFAVTRNPLLSGIAGVVAAAVGAFNPELDDLTGGALTTLDNLTGPQATGQLQLPIQPAN